MEHDRRRLTCEAGSGRDHISGLPDELLHGILRRLRSPDAAARTSVLSRRWRRVWTSVPELVLVDDLNHHGASFLDAVDDVLAAYSVPHVHALVIAVPHDAPAQRVASWLGFASRRLAGVLHLHWRQPILDRGPSGQSDILRSVLRSLALRECEELELPPCERATTIELFLGRLVGKRFLLRLPQPGAGMFTALANLQISDAILEGRALEALVSTQCPRLQKLSMWSITLVAASDVSLRSGTLQQLRFDVQDTLRLHVSAPALQVLEVHSNADHVHVAAPRLAEVVWRANCAHLVFADAGSHLRRLEVTRRDAMAPLMRRFTSLDELELGEFCLIAGAGDAFSRFLDDTNYNLLKCKTLRVSGMLAHAFALALLQLLGRVNGIRKLHVSYTVHPSEVFSTASPVPLPESSVNNIVIDSLEEIKIHLCGESANEHVEFLKMILFNIWSNTKLKSVVTNMKHKDPSLLSEICEKIHAICPSNIRMLSNDFPREGHARFETKSADASSNDEETRMILVSEHDSLPNCSSSLATEDLHKMDKA